MQKSPKEGFRSLINSLVGWLHGENDVVYGCHILSEGYSVVRMYSIISLIPG